MRRASLLSVALLLLGFPSGVLPAWCQQWLAVPGAKAPFGTTLLVTGDSVTAGSDGNETGVAQFGSPCGGNLSGGIFTYLSCLLDSYDFVHEATAGKGSTHSEERVVSEWNDLADGGTAGTCADEPAGVCDGMIYSMHVNDCASLKCGCECVGGTRDGEDCEADQNCLGGGTCSNTTGGACTNPGGGGTGVSCRTDQSRENIEFAFDFVAGESGTALFWKSPCHVARLEADSAGTCGAGTEQFEDQFEPGRTPASIHDLFLDNAVAGYVSNPLVRYTAEPFLDFCAPPLQSCPADRYATFVQTEWWTAHDAVSNQRRGNEVHCHPNALGYREIADKVARAIGETGDEPPAGAPVISPVSCTSSSCTVDVTAAGPDPDAGAHPGTDAGLETVVWLVCGPDMNASTDLTCHGACSGEGGSPCNGNTDSLIGGAWLERECGTRFAADRNGDGQRDVQTFAGSGTQQLVFGSLGASTDYKVCAVTLGDRYRGSLPAEHRFVTTGS